jgi:uncharacterized protein YqeY
MLKQQIEQDLKQALLSGDKDRVLTLRSLKSVILYAEVAKGVRGEGLPDDEITALFTKEVKKRQESADLYTQGGAEDRAAKELAEKKIIEIYLPEQLSEEKLAKIIDAAIAETSAEDMSGMGKVIGLVKQKAGATADGSRIAQMVKERLARK